MSEGVSYRGTTQPSNAASGSGIVGTRNTQAAQGKTQPSAAASGSRTASTRNTQPSQADQGTTQPSTVASGSGTAGTRNTQPSVVASASYFILYQDTRSMRSRTSEDILSSVRGKPRATGLRGRLRIVGFGILFSDPGTLIERCGSRDRVIYSPTKIVNARQTNIDLGYSAPGLRWQGRNTITQRQLQQQLRRRQTQASLSQSQVYSSSQPSQSPCHNLSQSQQNINHSQP
nr:uncharacterized protein LOC104114185 [Nicotiana tomentosiformis]